MKEVFFNNKERAMNKQVFLIMFLLFCKAAPAQWSVLQGDPRPTKEEKYLYQVFTRSQWNASNFAKKEDLEWHSDARYGMFIHFGLNSYVSKDMSWPIVYDRKAPIRVTVATPTKTGKKHGHRCSNLKNSMPTNGWISPKRLE